MIILLNREAGGAERAYVRAFLQEYFRAQGVEAAVREARAGDEITGLARRAVLGGERTVVAAGGDGTVGAVASALAGGDAALGVLPVGTLNHFAKDIGIPLDLETAARTLLTGRIAAIDAGEVNGRLFVNNSSLGLYPAIVFERKRHRLRGWNKWLAMAWASLSVFERFPSLELYLEAGGRGARIATPFVFVGNNEYQVEGFNLGRREACDRGLLWVFAAPHRSSRWRLARLTLRAFAGRVRQDRDFHAFPARELWIESARPRLRVALDGEVALLAPPLHYRSRPGALRVIVPREAS